MSPSEPKARFYTRINENDYLSVTVWPVKSDPLAEVITLQLRRNEGEKWEISVYLKEEKQHDNQTSGIK